MEAGGLHAAVIGGSGFTGGEMCRLLLGHPGVGRISPTSRADVSFERAHRNLLGSGLTFRPPEEVLRDNTLDVAFFCTPTGQAMRQAPALLDRGVRVVDLSADFRFPDPVAFERAHGVAHTAPMTLSEAVYGLTELNRDAVRDAQLVANPGCYVVATALALAPLLRAGLVDLSAALDVFAVNGMSGASSEPRPGILHADVFGSMLPYNLSGHRHAPELEDRLSAVAGVPVQIDLTTSHGNFVRGICAQAVVPLSASDQDRSSLLAVCSAFYDGEPFVAVNDFVSTGGPNEKVYDIVPAVKDVAGSNRCQIGLDVDRRTGRAKIVSVIDNLGKGAAGSALQNMNVMLALPETLGLGHYGL